MSVQLTITYGSTTLNLQASGYTVLDPVLLQTAEDAGSTVTERFDIEIIGSSESDLISKVRAIELALEHARTHLDYDQPAYLNFSPSATLTTSRSRIRDGLVLFGRKFTRNWKRLRAVVGLAVERDGYWEGAEAQVPLTNTNGTDNTSGLNVYNCADGSGTSPNDRMNYVAIDGADVEGDLPGLTRIEMVNPTTYTPTQIWIGHNYTNPSSFVWNFEGEDATVASGTTTPDANSSAGDYATCGTFYGNGSFNTLFTWALSSAQVDAAAGRPVHVMVRFASPPNSAIRFRLQTKIEAGASDPVDFTGTTVYLDSGYAHAWRDLGVLRIPARLMGLTGNIGRNLVLQAAYDDLVNLYDLSIDTIMLMPADGWRVLSATVGRFPQTYRLADDALNGRIVLDDAADTNRSGGWHGLGLPIALQPGKAQRLYFIQHNTLADSAPIDMRLTVKLYYRPRSKTV